MRGKFQEKLLSELSTPLVTMLLWPELLVPYFAVKKKLQDKLKCIPLSELINWNLKFPN